MANDISEKKPCYFWRQYRYHVDPDAITLKGWIQWCNELYKIQHGKPRSKANKIFVPDNLKDCTVKARIWNKDQIEKWLTDHGYEWYVTVETKYQFPFDDENEVWLIDSDAILLKRGA